jgi:hypothetical protein
MRRARGIPAMLKYVCRLCGVVAGLVPAATLVPALRTEVRGRWDKPGDDTGV